MKVFLKGTVKVTVLEGAEKVHKETATVEIDMVTGLCEGKLFGLLVPKKQKEEEMEMPKTEKPEETIPMEED